MADKKIATKSAVAKKTIVKAEIKAPKKNVPVKKEQKEAVVAVVAKKHTGLSLDVYDMTGKVHGTVDLPKELFGEEINKALISQAVRVYLANQRQGTSSTKTRGEVRGSTRKIYKQKGTGRARHGGVRAPIFVKGGIAHGPKPKDHTLIMPKKMRRKALFSALTAKLQENGIKVISDLSKVEQKTKNMITILKNIGIEPTKKTLIVMPSSLDHVYKAARNIQGVSVMAADRLNTYEVLNNTTLILMQEAIDTMKKVFLKEHKSAKGEGK